MLRLKLIESTRYYTTLRRLLRIGFIALLIAFPAMYFDLPDGWTDIILVVVFGLLLYQIYQSLRIRNDTERRRLEVDETGVGVRTVKTQELEQHWPWAALTDVQLEMNNNLSRPSWAQTRALFTGTEAKNYLAFRADGTAHRFDFLLESDYAERRLAALVGGVGKNATDPR